MQEKLCRNRPGRTREGKNRQENVWEEKCRKRQACSRPGSEAGHR